MRLMIDSDMVKMPRCCGECPLGFGGFCAAAPSDTDGKCPPGGVRPNWCPMKSAEPVESRRSGFSDTYGEMTCTWNYVCSECKAPIEYKDDYCRCCGRPLIWKG